MSSAGAATSSWLVTSMAVLAACTCVCTSLLCAAAGLATAAHELPSHCAHLAHLAHLEQQDAAAQVLASGADAEEVAAAGPSTSTGIITACSSQAAQLLAAAVHLMAAVVGKASQAGPQGADIWDEADFRCVLLAAQQAAGRQACCMVLSQHLPLSLLLCHACCRTLLPAPCPGPGNTSFSMQPPPPYAYTCTDPSRGYLLQWRLHCAGRPGRG